LKVVTVPLFSQSTIIPDRLRPALVLREVRCAEVPLWVIRVGSVMSGLRPLYP
jgi:hypothetical protein